VNAGIRPAGTVDSFDARKNFTKRFFDALLNAKSNFLNLPTGVIRSVVSDDEFEFHRNANHKWIQMDTNAGKT